MTKKTIGALFCCLMSVLGGCNDDKSASTGNKSSTSDQTFIVGTSADNPPFEFLKDGKIVGFDIALMEEIGNLLHLEIKIQDMNFDGILGSLSSGRIQGAIAGLSATDERKKNMDFTIPYYTTGISMVTLKKDNLKGEEDLAEKNIATQAGSTYATYAAGPLSQKVKNITVKNLPRIPELIQDLKVERISAIIIGTKEAEIICRENSDMIALQVSADPGFSIGLPKGSPLTEKINRAIKELQNNGKMTQLVTQWLEN